MAAAQRWFDASSASCFVSGESLVKLDSSFVLAFHKVDSVKVVAFFRFEEARAKEAYHALSPNYAKVLIHKLADDVVLLQYGLIQFVDMCKEQVRRINCVFPHMGSALPNRGIERWFDSSSGCVETVRSVCAKSNLVKLDCSFILAYHKDQSVKVITFPNDETRAKESYAAVPLHYAKVLIHKLAEDTVLLQDGICKYVDMCKDEVLRINCAFPTGR